MVKRFDYVEGVAYEAWMEERSDGKYVLAYDYDALDRDCDGYIEDRDLAYARIRELEAAHRIDTESLMAKSALIGELEAIVRRFVAFDPYPDSALTKEARALLAADRQGESEKGGLT